MRACCIAGRAKEPSLRGLIVSAVLSVLEIPPGDAIISIERIAYTQGKSRWSSDPAWAAVIGFAITLRYVERYKIMPIVDIKNAYDLHIHSNPSLFNRIGSDLDIAQHAVESRLSGILLKNHFESTVGRAYQANLVVQGTHVFGGLVLNHFTGGINPVAVEHAIKLGAKQIWMPTLDSAAHAHVFGSSGTYGYQDSNTKIQREGIRILDETGKLTEPVKVIVELVKSADVALGTAHLSRQEIFLLTEFAQKETFHKLLITHPYFNPPKLSVEDQVELSKMGATIELCGGNLYPIPGVAKLSDYLQSISKVGAASLILTSDSGQPRKSMPAEVLRIFTQCLMDKGVSQQQIDMMTKKNPAGILGL
jgi:hypothetical protein